MQAGNGEDYADGLFALSKDIESNWEHSCPERTDLAHFPESVADEQGSPRSYLYRRHNLCGDNRRLWRQFRHHHYNKNRLQRWTHIQRLRFVPG
jgi:hypothetical protein